MGRKKKKPQKPWCWYCNREFEDEKILIQHQKAKHFKCHICNKKLFTGPGLAIHCMQVHKESIDKIPGALPGRDSVNIEVYGMEGIPPESVRGSVEGEEPPAKIPRPAGPSIPLPGMMPPGPPMMPMPPGGMPMQPFVRAGAQMPFGAMPQGLGFPPRFGGPMNAQQMAAMMAMPGGMPPMPPPVTSSIPPLSAIPPPGASAAAAGIPMPPQMAFAAYQDKDGTKAEDTKDQQDVPSSSMLMSKLGAKTRIVCPDELTSLEELMALRIVPTYTRGLLPFVR